MNKIILASILFITSMTSYAAPINKGDTYAGTGTNNQMGIVAHGADGQILQFNAASPNGIQAISPSAIFPAQNNNLFFSGPATGGPTVPTFRLIDKLMNSAGTQTSVDNFNFQLNDSAGNDSIRFSARIAYGTNGNPALDWNGKWLYDVAGNTSQSWQLRTLYDPTENAALNYQNRNLIDGLGNILYNWQLGTLYDKSAMLSIDTVNRTVNNSSGQIMADYDGGLLIDNGNFSAMLWAGGARELYDDAGNLAQRFTVADRSSYDSSENRSLNFGTRQAIANDGTTVKIDYSDPNFTDFYTVQGLEFQVAAGATPVINYLSVNGAPTGNTPIINTFGGDTDVGMTFMTQGAGSYDFTSGNGGLFSLIQPFGPIANNFAMFTATTGNAPVLEVGGSDTNVDMNLKTQGTGSFNFTSDTTTLLSLLNQTSAVNSFQMAAGITSKPSILSTVGADSNITMLLKTKGAGNFIVQSDNGDMLEVASNLSPIANSFIMFTGATGFSPTLAATGTDTNIDLTLATTGTGVVYAAAPLSTSGGLRVVEATNSKQGIGTLVGGTLVVANTSVGTNSRIFAFPQDNNCIGNLRVSTRTAGTSFTITSSVNTDTCVFAYEIFEAA